MAERKPLTKEQRDQRRAAQAELDSVLDEFREEVANHRWSFFADSFYCFIESTKEEADLWRRAQLLGMDGVRIYISYCQGAINTTATRRTEEAVQYHSEINRKAWEALYEEFPIIAYANKVKSHDWYFEFSDDSSVWRAGKKNEEALIKEAKEKGPEYEAIFKKYAYANKRDVSKVESFFIRNFPLSE